MNHEHEHDGKINEFATDDRGLVIHCIGNEDAWIKTRHPADLTEWS